ncbi:MAG: SurA N-terminal domain-containing protein [Desulfovibrionaceae bacterium]
MKKISVMIVALCMTWACSVQAATVNKIAAVVNGEMITVFDLHTTIQPELTKAKINPNNPASKQAVDQLTHKALDMMIMDILIAQEAARLKVTVSAGEIDGEISRMMQQSKLSKADFEKQLKNDGFSVDGLRERIRKTIMRQKLMGQMVGRKVVVTPEEIAQYYEEHKSQFTTGQKVQMAIMIYPPTVDALAWARKIKEGKSSFEAAVKAVSVGPNPQGGGRVAPVPVAEMNAAWQERIRSMRPGQVSDLFIIENHQAQMSFLGMEGSAEEQSLAEATKQIENILREPKLMERFQDYTDQLRKKAVIDVRL